MKKILRVSEVAKIFEVTPYTVRLWLREGILEGIKPEGTKAWRIPRESVEKLVNQKYGGNNE